MTAADIAFVYKKSLVYEELLKSGARHHSQQQLQVGCTPISYTPSHTTSHTTSHASNKVFLFS